MTKPFSGWTIVTDLDGTLFKSADNIPEENIKAIAYWRELGGQFTIATGRYRGSTLSIYQKLELDAPFIYNNGASIYHPKQELYDSIMVFGKAILPVVSDILERVPTCGIAGYDKESLFLIRSNPSMERHLKRQSIIPKPVTDNETIETFCKILLTVESIQMDALKSQLAKAPYCSDFCFTQSTDEFYEITRIGASKGEQLPNLCRLLGTVTEKLIVVGDNENDLSMLDATPYSFAVANATPAAQKAAKFVTEARGDTGAALAEVINIMAKKILTEAGNGTI